MGPEITEDQFDCVQLMCKTCMRTRQMQKPHAHNRKLPPEDMRVLQEVWVDIIGPRAVPSLNYTTERGNLDGGGNRFAVIYIDKGTEKGWISFVREKSELEANVSKMANVLSMAARDSLDYKGEELKVQRWISDRDANLTSHKAVALMLAEKMEHRMAATDAKNQTPLLDNIVRRLLRVTSSNLDQAGLGGLEIETKFSYK